MRCAVLVLLLSGLLAGCARTHDHLPLAWWIEDCAHGIPRRPAELETAHPPPPMLLAYLGGDLVDGIQKPPLPLRQRAERRPRLQEAFRSGRILLQDGEVGPSPRLVGKDLREAAALADQENLDRRQVDVLVITLGRMDEAEAMRYRDAIHAVRTELDRADGGKPWTPAR
jgi:hypothetical protein